jgi:hypothetical protein
MNNPTFPMPSKSFTEVQIDSLKDSVKSLREDMFKMQESLVLFMQLVRDLNVDITILKERMDTNGKL